MLIHGITSVFELNNAQLHQVNALLSTACLSWSIACERSNLMGCLLCLTIWVRTHEQQGRVILRVFLCSNTRQPKPANLKALAYTDLLICHSWEFLCIIHGTSRSLVKTHLPFQLFSWKLLHACMPCITCFIQDADTTRILYNCHQHR